MRIYSMTATFGKLEHQTLTLTPGLNIIEAPNEWGKSTWCAFLVNMLYGIDTRARSTGTALADKERYAPWSGASMAGRIDLNWNGRDITIERRTKGRAIFGDFNAYETATGMDVPELNAANCGQTLLGVERSVFTRAGFLKFSDLPVTQDDSLRRRLNNLVTTGDESGTGDRLSQTLKELKNKCRYNRSGLLPQAENEREQLRSQLDDLHSLKNQAELIKNAQAQLESHIVQLENHSDALRYAAAREDADKVTAADDAAMAAQQRLSIMMAACEELPAREEAQRKLAAAQALQEEGLALQMEATMLPPLPAQPEISTHCRDTAAAEADAKQASRLENSKKKNRLIIGIVLMGAILALAALAVLTFGLNTLEPLLFVGIGGAAVIAVIAVFAACAVRTKRISKEILALYDRHAGIPVKDWAADAQKQADAWHTYETQLQNAQALRSDLDTRTADLKTRMDALCGGSSMTECQSDWAKTLAVWDSLGDARRDAQRAESHAKTLRAMAKPVPPPKAPDTLTLSAEETANLLTEARFKQRQLHVKLGQCMGQTESIGSETLLKARLDTLNRRIQRLEDTYYALEMAQDSLREATITLQRRFAPRIARRTQELFGRLTDGRYDRLTLGEDFTLSTSATEEDTLRTPQWRSDGTADQLYLALRLAVSEELTADAPLVLDDALVRFDDLRLKKAMEILKEEAKEKQVILFTCQSREKSMEDSL